MLFQKTCPNEVGQRLATPVSSRSDSTATRQAETLLGLRRDGRASVPDLERGDWNEACRPPVVSSGTSQERERISMATWTKLSPSDLSRDLAAGLVVSLVALPLCLGVALASNAPLLSGVVAGIVGGMLVGILSGSQASVSGPAAGLTAVVASQIAALGSFQAFLLAVMIAGLLQIALGLARAGSLAAFFPSSVIKGLMAAIGLILILKQIPHVLGHDPDPEGDMAFRQPDDANTRSPNSDVYLATSSPAPPWSASYRSRSSSPGRGRDP